LFPDILADENISSSVISNLRGADFKVLSIKDDYRGLSDVEIIKLAVKFNSLILNVTFTNRCCLLYGNI